MKQNEMQHAALVAIVSRRRVTIPRRILDAAGLRAGDRVDVRATGAGQVLLSNAEGDRAGDKGDS